MDKELLDALHDLSGRMITDGDDYVYDYGMQLQNLLPPREENPEEWLKRQTKDLVAEEMKLAARRRPDG